MARMVREVDSFDEMRNYLEEQRAKIEAMRMRVEDL